MVSITHYLYRKTTRRAIAASVAVFLAVTICAAQRSPQQSGPPSSSASAKKKHPGPRAIAVLEFLPGGGTRLVPVALLLDGRYYDASLYDANPAPMAVEPQTVYEAQSFGEPTGIFTITMPKQINGNWVADGTWKPHLAMDEKAAADAASKPKTPSNRAVLTNNTADDSRPVLKRAPGSAGDSASGNSQPSQSPNSADSDRPVMKRPASDSSSKPTMGPSDDSPPSATSKPAQVEDNDPNRPVMKRASPPAGSDSNTQVTQAVAASNDNDPNRPMLSRSNTPKKQGSADIDLSSPVTDSPKASAPKGTRSYPAVSDAADYRARPMLYSMSPGERKTQEDQVLKLVLDEIRAFAAKRNGSAIPKTATISDYDARAFDLDYSSSPTIVITAKLPIADSRAAANFAYYATIVARIDINDQPVKIFSSVTDSLHLDAFPRLELIDAVDADANGHGDLLFRQYYDTGITYGIYRVSPYQIEKVFEGGSAL